MKGRCKGMSTVCCALNLRGGRSSWDDQPWRWNDDVRRLTTCKGRDVMRHMVVSYIMQVGDDGSTSVANAMGGEGKDVTAKDGYMAGV